MSPEEEKNLKELYDDLANEENMKSNELKRLKEEESQISRIFDCYGVPKTDNKIKLSNVERLELAMKMFAKI